MQIANLTSETEVANWGTALGPATNCESAFLSSSEPAVVRDHFAEAASVVHYVL